MLRVAAVLALLVAGMSLLAEAGAFTTAVPANGGQVTVVSTTAGELALAPGTGNANSAGWAYTSGGQLVLDYTRGYNGLISYGFQSNSTYTFNRIFTVTNNAGASRSVTMTVTDDGGAAVPELNQVTGSVGPQNYVLVGAGAGAAPLGAGQTMLVSFRFMPGAGSAARNLRFTVSGS